MVARKRTLLPFVNLSIYALVSSKDLKIKSNFKTQIQSCRHTSSGAHAKPDKPAVPRFKTQSAGYYIRPHSACVVSTARAFVIFLPSARKNRGPLMTRLTFPDSGMGWADFGFAECLPREQG